MSDDPDYRRGYELRIKPDALEEIGEATDYIERESPAGALQWVEGLWELLDQLAERPTGYGHAREDPDATPPRVPVRQVIYHCHRIVFAVADADRVVLVLHVWHVSPPGYSAQSASLTHPALARPGGRRGIRRSFR